MKYLEDIYPNITNIKHISMNSINSMNSWFIFLETNYVQSFIHEVV